ncbi:glycosyltransferase [Pedobacter sp. BAL39]|uniref:sugar transferase n=1 Tax=Pedobacter sp. BAL39 TaxID=391596 RepID=UPI0001559A9D|nr:sugar transferase [Pedobacter sp. BAL39]EDM38332.1 glycosyltransferase [Pedobacter sp. BAL39]
MKRLFDVLFAISTLFFLAPVFFVVAILLRLDSSGPIYYKQVRVGLKQKPFRLIKFRTMYLNAEKHGLLTVGDADCRVTRIGYWLRKYKVDELPQLFNVLIGDMSLVGPRPEVAKYVALYDPEQQRVLSVKPGITDWASIAFVNESQLLAGTDDPEAFYIHTIIPLKINQNLRYVDHHSLWIDLKIISCTLRSIILK